MVNRSDEQLVAEVLKLWPPLQPGCPDLPEEDSIESDWHVKPVICLEIVRAGKSI